MKAVAAVIAAILAVIVLLYVATAPTPPAEMTPVQVAEVEAGVLQAAEDWMDAWRGNDCELTREVWHPQRIAQPRVGSIGLTVDEWVESCAEQMSNRASFEGEWTDTDVRVISEDAAVFSGTYTATFGYHDETPSRHYPEAAQVMLFERTDTGWGLVFFVNSSAPWEVVEEES